ncbi:MAG: ribosome biogenesis GTPase Der [Clostridia bacterium]|jgi:GTP-binding protein|nr:ribosome biogenesis GTPase Der [Clostridia bacterium]
MNKPIVAIVGRPNVGKSTFFNKIAGKRISIVEDVPGVTRDRIHADAEWLGHEFTLIDTGGIDPHSEDVLLSQMRMQAQTAIDLADVICFFTDAREGLTEDDKDVANLLRRAGKPVLLVVNKVDYLGLNNSLYEFYELGLGDPIGISSVNMLGFGDLLDQIISCFPDRDPSSDEEEETVIQMAIVGRPNVGKSSLTNRLLGQERTMVSDIPGTTRDAIDTIFHTEDGTAFNIIDTAGMRRKSSIEDESLERYSVLRSIAAIKRCDVALLLVDANDGVTEQDTKIAGLIHEEGKAVIVIVNKWDMLEKETGTLEKYRKEVIEKIKFMDYAPVLFISAKTGQRTNTVFDKVKEVYETSRKRITTGILNDVVNDATGNLQPPLQGTRRLKIYYATQTGIQPPTFVFFVNDETLMSFSYERYLENFFRKTFPLEGTPIRFILRERKKED